MNVELEIKPYSQGGVCVRALKFQVKWEGFLGKCHCRQPDSGNPTVRDEKGACGNVGQRLEGEQLTRSSRLRRGVYLKSTAQMLNWRSRAPYFYPTDGNLRGELAAEITEISEKKRIQLPLINTALRSGIGVFNRGLPYPAPSSLLS